MSVQNSTVDSAHTEDKKDVKQFTGRHFLMSILAFFGIVMSVNGYMIFEALHNHPGVVTDHNYERSLAYNDTLEHAAYQKSLGWTTNLSITANQDEMVYVIHDRSGNRLGGKDVTVKMVRAVRDGYDFVVPLKEVSAGRYQAPFKAPLRGTWDAHVTIKWEENGEQHVYYDEIPVVLD